MINKRGLIRPARPECLCTEPQPYAGHRRDGRIVLRLIHMHPECPMPDQFEVRDPEICDVGCGHVQPFHRPTCPRFIDLSEIKGAA